ncbi:MAG: hypothetical protein ACKVRO_07885 [Micropepsaceae bacterium]|jgi:hypothetical protein
MSTGIAKTVELYAAVHLTVIGLSHVLQPGAWVRFFLLLRAQGEIGAFVNGFMSLVFGAIIVAFHNIWEGSAIVLTLLGWAQIVKAAVNFLAPQAGLRSLNRVALDRAWEFQVGGAVLLVVAGWLVFRLAQGI